MSLSYNIIEGFGIDINRTIFDPLKLNKLFGVTDEYTQTPCHFYSISGNYSVMDIFDELFAKDEFERHSKYLWIGDTDDLARGTYLLYAPNHPWVMSDDEKNLTQANIEELIVDVLRAITVLSKDDIIKDIKQISTAKIS